MAAVPPICDFGWQAPDFSLRSTEGHRVSLNDVRGENGTVVMFICNHCPYVLAILDRLVSDAKTLQANGISIVAINANDTTQYPADSFDNMIKLSKDNAFPFAYLHDDTQEIARAYDAVCTPDFFGFNANLELQYRGRLDAAGINPAPSDMPRDLVNAMMDIAKTGQGPAHQIPSMGCSIKWKS